MTTQTLTLYVHPDGLLSANQRLHWARKAGKTRHLRTLACHEAKRQRLHPVTGRQKVTATYGFLTHSRRRDVGNMAPTTKAIVDGIVDAGVLVDDDDRHIEGPDHRTGALSSDCQNRPRPLRRVQINIRLEDTSLFGGHSPQATATNGPPDEHGAPGHRTKFAGRGLCGTDPVAQADGDYPDDGVTS